jgi:hypothetical protein
MTIEMVDLKSQYAKIQQENDVAVLNVIKSCNFIKIPSA